VRDKRIGQKDPGSESPLPRFVIDRGMQSTCAVRVCECVSQNRTRQCVASLPGDPSQRRPRICPSSLARRTPRGSSASLAASSSARAMRYAEVKVMPLVAPRRAWSGVSVNRLIPARAQDGLPSSRLAPEGVVVVLLLLLLLLLVATSVRPVPLSSWVGQEGRRPGAAATAAAE